MTIDEIAMASQSVVFYLLMGSISFITAIVIHGIIKNRRNSNS
jgi:hypothetical protein